VDDSPIFRAYMKNFLSSRYSLEIEEVLTGALQNLEHVALGRPVGNSRLTICGVAVKAAASY